MQERESLAIVNLVVACDRVRLTRSNGKVRNFMVDLDSENSVGVVSSFNFCERRRQKTGSMSVVFM